MLLADRFCKKLFRIFFLFVFREFMTQKLNAKNKFDSDNQRPYTI